MNPTTCFSARDLVAALAVILIWGLNFVAMKIGLRELSPMQLGAARYFFAAIPLVLLVRKPSLPWGWVLGYGLVQGIGQFGLLFLALHVGMTAALASVLMQMQVFFTVILGIGVLGEQLSHKLRVGLFFALAGISCFAMSFLPLGGAASIEVTLIGFVLTLGAAAMWGASNVLARHLQRNHPGYDALQFVVWSALAPIIPFVLLSLAVDGHNASVVLSEISWSAWAAAAFLGWFATVLAYGLWTWLLKRHPANRVAPFGLGVPVVGLVAGIVLLGEHLSPWQIAGIACIAASLLYVMWPQPMTATRRTS